MRKTKRLRKSRASGWTCPALSMLCAAVLTGCAQIPESPPRETIWWVTGLVILVNIVIFRFLAPYSDTEDGPPDESGRDEEK